MNDQISSIRGLLESPFGAQFDDPAFRQQAQRIDAILNDGEDSGDLTADGLYAFASQLFMRELQRGVGEKLPDGSTIAQKRLVRAYEDGDSIILELAITAQRPDGSTFEYSAPVTRGRTAAETDEVLKLPVAAVRDRLRGASMLAQGIERGGGREAILAQLQGQEQGQSMGLQGPSADVPFVGAQRRIDPVQEQDFQRAAQSVLGGRPMGLVGMENGQ